jgi:hypothetical protein
MSGPVRVDSVVRVAPSGWENAKSGGFAGSVRVVSVGRVPKNSWAEKHATPSSANAVRRFFSQRVLNDPDDPDDPDGSSVYAGFRKSLTLTNNSLHPDYPDHFYRIDNFMVRKMS